MTITREPTTVIKQREGKLILSRGPILLFNDQISREGGGTVALGWKENLLAQILLLNFNRSVAYNEMMDWLYVQHENVETDNSEHSLDVTLHHLREKLDRIGIILVRWHSVGFRMMSK